jgi:hypothetical protein
MVLQGHLDLSNNFLPGVAALARGGSGVQMYYPEPPINICTQNPAKCPVDESTWPGEPDAWKVTGRKWQWHSGTPSGIGVIWEWSAPYAGTNPAYSGQRENHYDDYSNTPDGYPIVTGTAPIPFSWARWEPVSDNYILHQYGGTSEELAFSVGESDCDTGIYYPITGPDVAYAYTPMSVVLTGQCVSGGYISVYRSDMWGPPLSPVRVNRCDDPDTGIPISQSQRGNAICKLSPYVAVVSQRYVFGPEPTPTDGASVGCEMVLYAWGWPSPQQVSSGQDYQTRFRNGELRFSRWLNLSSQVSDTLPAPDDHSWWETRCEQGWSDMTNWVYTGLYRIGDRVYTDTVALPPTTVVQIPISGGHLTSTLDNSLYVFPPNTFTDTVTLTHTIRFQSDLTATDGLIGINRVYELSAVYSSSGQSAQPAQPYTVTIQYTEADQGATVEDTLALYYLDGDQWIREPTSMVFTDTNTIVATPGHLSLWAVLGETERVFLPLLLR